MKHSGGGAVGQWLLRDQLFGQVVVEIGYQHTAIMPEALRLGCGRTCFVLAEGCDTITRLGLVASWAPSEVCVNTIEQLRDDIVRFGKMLHQNGLVAATDGNISVRMADGTVLCTPTLMSKGMMEADDLVIVDEHGRKLSGRREVSSEIAMHLLIYRKRPDVNAVVHAHPPTATGFAAAGIPLDTALCSEIVVTLARCRWPVMVRRALPNSPKRWLPDCDHQAILMANHGVVTYGEDLLTAYMNMETVEHYAKIAWYTHMLGRQAAAHRRASRQAAAKSA